MSVKGLNLLYATGCERMADTLRCSNSRYNACELTICSVQKLVVMGCL